jgi:hypothetical protein
MSSSHINPTVVSPKYDINTADVCKQQEQSDFETLFADLLTCDTVCNFT